MTENKNQRTAKQTRRPLFRYLIAIGISLLLILLSLILHGFFSPDQTAQFAIDTGIVVGTEGDVVMPQSAAYSIIQGVADTSSVLSSPDWDYIRRVCRIRMLCDSLFTAGVLVFGFGGLIFVAQNGAYDGLTYSIRQLGILFQLGRKWGGEHQSFRDYQKRRAEKPKNPFAHLLICGGVLLLAAFILTQVFERL